MFLFNATLLCYSIDKIQSTGDSYAKPLKTRIKR